MIFVEVTRHIHIIFNIDPQLFGPGFGLPAVEPLVGHMDMLSLDIEPSLTVFKPKRLCIIAAFVTLITFLNLMSVQSVLEISL